MANEYTLFTVRSDTLKQDATLSTRRKFSPVPSLQEASHIYFVMPQQETA